MSFPLNFFDLRVGQIREIQLIPLYSFERFAHVKEPVIIRTVIDLTSADLHVFLKGRKAQGA